MITSLIFRERIYGAHNDLDLYALDGIVEWSINECNECDHTSIQSHIDEFENHYPNFKWDYCEFVRS